MSNSYYARLLLRAEDVTPEVETLIQAGRPYESCGTTGDGFYEICGEPKWGEFGELEKSLVQRGIPFDRYTESVAGDPAIERRFRPGRGDKPAVDVVVELDGYSEPAVAVKKLKDLLGRCKDFPSLRDGLGALIHAAEPVPPLGSEQEEGSDVQPGQLVFGQETAPPSQLAYPTFIFPLEEDDGGGWAAEIPDLPGCMSDGRTPEKALHNVAEAQEVWIESARSRGLDVPTPFPEGHRAVVMRLPEDLYRRLAMKAWKNGVAVGDIVLGLLRRDVTTNDVGKLPQRVG